MIATVREAWRTAVPDMADRHGPLPPLLLLLTVVTGLVDAFSYLGLGHVFVANMTGNVIFAGLAIAGAPGFSLTATVVPLVGFAAGAFLGGRIVRYARSHRALLLYFALALQTLVIAAAWLMAEASRSPVDTGIRFPLLGLLGLGMGVQNAAARALAVPDLTTTVLTLTVTGMAADSRLAGGPGAKAGRRLLSTGAMFLGGLVGAVVILHGHQTLPLLLATLLLVVASASARWFTRSSAPWTRPL
jgi:uncharacterized membrane protein YoaK (UPF0700 family)